MADLENKQSADSPITLTITDENGNKTSLTAAQVIETATNNESEQDKYLYESISFVEVIHKGFAEIDLHPKDPYGVFENINLVGYGEKATIRPGRYYVLTDEWLEENRTGGFDDSELEALKTGELSGLILIDDLNQIADEGIAGFPVTIRAAGEDGADIENPPYEPYELYILTEPGTTNFVTVYDLVSSLYLMGAVNLVVTDLKPSADNEKIEVVELANFKTTESFENHGLIFKTLDEGLFHIAMGNDYFELKPKSGNSKERYRLTASKGACSDFFENKGNAEIVKKVLETVFTIMDDERAESFVTRGRVWITVNAIVQEMRRTEGGTISAKDYKNDREMVDRALLAVSGAQIVGTKANGEPVNSIYVMNAVRRDKVVYNNQTYYDVWGFETDITTANDYAKDLGYTHKYPLLKMGKPMTLDEAWIDRYLKDALNQARNELYTTDKNGNPKPTKAAKAKVVRSWEAIFDKAFPTGGIDSRKKTGVVKRFEKMLTVLAEMDCHGELREGYPMSIKAYSERDARRGRGAGAWENLVIECTRETHRPKIDLK